MGGLAVCLCLIFTASPFFFFHLSLLFNPLVFVGFPLPLPSLCFPPPLFPTAPLFFLFNRVLPAIYSHGKKREEKKNSEMRARIHLDLLCPAIGRPDCQPALGGHLCRSLSLRYRCRASPVAHNHPSIYHLSLRPSFHPDSHRRMEKSEAGKMRPKKAFCQRAPSPRCYIKDPSDVILDFLSSLPFLLPAWVVLGFTSGTAVMKRRV